MLGQTIGQYRVTDILGEGGMGVVYAAEHTLLGRPAAVKVLRPELSQKQEVVTRFFNEARSATAFGRTVPALAENVAPLRHDAGAPHAETGRRVARRVTVDVGDQHAGAVRRGCRCECERPRKWEAGD